MSPSQFIDGDADPNDPTDERSVDFDWEGLEHALGEEDLGPVEYRRLAFALGRVLRWLVMPKTGSGTDGQLVIARRVVALAWVIEPRFFDDSPSLRTLAKRLGLGVDCLSHHAAGASRKFGIQNAFQASRSRARRAKRADLPTNSLSV